MIPTDRYISVQNLFELNTKLKLGLTSRAVKKGELFLKAGQNSDYFYYVLKGFVRLYYLDLEGNEVTHWFSGENSMVTSPFSFFKKEKNIMHFEALEDTELLQVTSEQMDSIMAQSKTTEKAFRHLLAEFIMVLSRRIMDIQTLSAEDRYLKLMREHPLIFQKAKLSHIASFLGITQQSLSRIRKNI